jgi:hypothetical protein
MYRSCIFCSAPLGSNESIERFPVGRSLAFDAARGRLWAVCRSCARWNLAPIEERWEAIEEAERLFRDARLRVQSENIGLTKLRDGTRLVRVGPAIQGELALFRYGELLLRRRRRYLAYTAAGLAAGATAVAAGAAAGAGLVGVYWIGRGMYVLRDKIAGMLPVARVSAAQTSDGAPAVIHRANVAGSRLQRAEDGGLSLYIPAMREVQVQVRPYVFDIEWRGLTLHGDTALRVLSRAMVAANAAGARRDSLQEAVSSLAGAGSPGEYVMRLAREQVVLGTGGRVLAQSLALEMALHEETERRALNGELAMLEGMWREAEQIAAIADRLPEIPAPEPPRLDPVR